MSAIDHRAALVELIASSTTHGIAGDLIGADRALVIYVLDMCEDLGLDPTPILLTENWFDNPVLLMSIVCGTSSAALWRECRLHAVWCARRVAYLVPHASRWGTLTCLDIAAQYARGEVCDLTIAQGLRALKSSYGNVEGYGRTGAYHAMRAALNASDYWQFAHLAANGAARSARAAISRIDGEDPVWSTAAARVRLAARSRESGAQNKALIARFLAIHRAGVS
jgi:hypothetical protein